MLVEYISHACLKIKGSFGTLICDPWILNEPVFNLTTWKFPPVRSTPNQIIKDANYLLLTHSHEDHFHVPSLNYFDRGIQIILSDFSRHCSYRGQTIERVLLNMGFHNIRNLKEFEKYRFDNKFTLTSIPSAYSRDHDWENSGFVISDGKTNLLNLNDNLNDKDLCLQIKSRFKKIDICFIQSGGVTMFPGRFKMSLSKMRKTAKKYKDGLFDQKNMLKYIKPKFIVPHAGDFCWLNKGNFHQNWANRGTPKLLEDLVNKKFPKTKFLSMQPGDSWSKKNGIKYSGRRIDWNNYLNEIEKVKKILSSKVKKNEKYLEHYNKKKIFDRTVSHMNTVIKFITRDYIDFKACMKFSIIGKNSNFSFYLFINDKNRLDVSYRKKPHKINIDQTLLIKENIWSNILSGKLMLDIIQWNGLAIQKYFKRDMARFWYWFEYHIDLNGKNIQMILSDKLWKGVKKYRPKQGVTGKVRTKLIEKFYS